MTWRAGVHSVIGGLLVEHPKCVPSQQGRTIHGGLPTATQIAAVAARRGRQKNQDCHRIALFHLAHHDRMCALSTPATLIVHRANIKTFLGPACSLPSRRGDQCGQFSQNLGVRWVEFNAGRYVEACTGSGGWLLGDALGRRDGKVCIRACIKQWAAGDGHVRRRRRRGSAASAGGPARLTR
jgi:hypothetical protein